MSILSFYIISFHLHSIFSEPTAPLNGLTDFPVINSAADSSGMPIVELSTNGSAIVRNDPFHQNYELWRSIAQQVNQIKLHQCNQNNHAGNKHQYLHSHGGDL